MNLASDLISAFVKATKDDTKTKTESTVYGTTVEQDGVMFVRLDGSTILTPVLTTANTKAGERVTVMIKNHTATIMGNLTSPAARVADVGDVTAMTADVKALQTATADNTSNIKILQGHVAKLTPNYVVTHDIKDVWTYETWSNGKAECWARYSASGINASVNSLNGLYYSEPITVTFPITFDGVPVIHVDGGDPLHMHYVRELGSTATEASFVIVCNDSTQTSVDVSVSIHAIGNYVAG